MHYCLVGAGFNLQKKIQDSQNWYFTFWHQQVAVRPMPMLFIPWMCPWLDLFQVKASAGRPPNRPDQASEVMGDRT